MFDKLKKILKIVSFSGSMTLKDGTEIMVEGSLEVGSKVSIQSDGEMMPLPDGEYILENDSILVVAEGIITDIIEPTDEPEVIETEEEDEVIEPEPTDEPEVDEPTEIEALTERLNLLEQRINEIESLFLSKEKELKDENEKLKTDFNVMKERLEKTSGADPLKMSKVKNEPEIKSVGAERYENIMKIIKK